jgi:predicted amidohydrolase
VVVCLAVTKLRSLGAAQTIPVRGAVDENIEQHVRLVRAAADEGAELLVFPELSLTGYELDLAGDLAFSEDDPRLLPLVDSASAASMILIVGAPVKIETELHIGAFIVLPSREIDVHTKHRLGAFSPEVSPDRIVPPAEDTVFRPGSRRPLVSFRGESAAIGICAESLWDEHPKAAAERGATFYLTGHFSIPLDVDFRAAILGGHAARHAMTVVFANYGGPTGGLPGAGKSAIWSDRGGLVAKCDARSAGVVIANESEAGWVGKAVALG